MLWIFLADVQKWNGGWLALWLIAMMADRYNIWLGGGQHIGRSALEEAVLLKWIPQPIFMKIPILETHWYQEQSWQMSQTYIEVLWICPLDRRLFKSQFVNSVCKICQNLNRKRGNNSISSLKHCFLKNNMWKNKQNTTTWYKCRVFCWDFDTFCRLN